MERFNSEDADFCLRAVSDNVLLTCKVNLAEGKHVIFQKADGFKSADLPVADYCELVEKLVREGWVHPMEGQQFLHNYDLKRMRNFFYHHARHEINYYRELYRGEYVLVSVEAFSPKDCSPENPWIFMVIKKVDASLTNNFYREAEYYYSREPLTKLWNRAKYEKDVDRLSQEGHPTTCVYIDVVGLHELNNHLGHKAGDQMLCAVADGLRKYFAADFIYRIGGDEFVVLCPDECEEDVSAPVLALKKDLQEFDYEISAGWAAAESGGKLRHALSVAESAMQADKKKFYANKGAHRQSRMMNVKLENMLLAKQDASEFLNIISDQFKGVYIVDMKRDRCRYIYIPPYFQEILEKHSNAYLISLKEYNKKLVKPEYHEALDKVCDYDYIVTELTEGRPVEMEYQKNNGDWVYLAVYPCYQGDKALHTTMWVFEDLKKDENGVDAQKAMWLRTFGF